jgi:hypothetical protein
MVGQGIGEHTGKIPISKTASCFWEKMKMCGSDEKRHGSLTWQGKPNRHG